MSLACYYVTFDPAAASFISILSPFLRVLCINLIRCCGNWPSALHGDHTPMLMLGILLLSHIVDIVTLVMIGFFLFE